MKNKKKIVFFDADGTLWYPKETKREVNSKWIYARYPKILDVRANLMLIPGVKDTLEKIKEQGIKTIVLSTSPLSPSEAIERLKGSLEHFGILRYFDEVYATLDYPESKGEHIAQILKKQDIDKAEALMIGDSYLWDYISAKDVGVDGVLFMHEYDIENYPKVENRLNEFSEILDKII